MPTRNIVPRANNEGSLGTSTYKWADIRATLATIGTVTISTLATIASATITTLTATTAVISGLWATLTAGDASNAPLTYTSGTNLTSAAAGATEYDGVQFYQTIDTSSGRGASVVEQYFHLTSDGSAISTINDFFGTNSNPKFVTSGYYLLDIEMFYTKSTSGTVTWTFDFDNNPTTWKYNYEMSPVTGTVNPPGTATMLMGQDRGTTSDISFATAALTTGVNHYAHFKMWMQVGGSTTLMQIQATCSAGSITPLKHSMWRLRRLSPNSVGTFAA